MNFNNFDVSTVPGMLNTTELVPIEGIVESFGYNRSPNTSIQGLYCPTKFSQKMRCWYHVTHFSSDKIRGLSPFSVILFNIPSFHTFNFSSSIFSSIFHPGIHQR